MSRIGARPIVLPSGVALSVHGSNVHVTGPRGELKLMLLPEVSVDIEGSTVSVKRKDDSDNAKARHGLTRVLLNNMAIGVSTGYEKKLEIIGVGYKAQIKGKMLVLNLGHSHPIDMNIPEGLEVSQDEKNKNIVIIRGIDKQLVGQFASDVRSFRPPEPYKGKGVRYTDEFVRRKPGKAAATKGAA